MKKTATKQKELKREECLKQDKKQLDRDVETCFVNPGCDYGASCVEAVKARAEDRVDTCTHKRKK